MIFAIALLLGVSAFLAAGWWARTGVRVHQRLLGPVAGRAREIGVSDPIPAAVWIVAAIVILLIGGSTGTGLLAAFAAIVLLAIPRKRLAARIAAHEQLVRNQFATLIAAIAAAVRAGQSLRTALETVARDAPEPAAAELHLANARLAGGLSPDAAFAPLSQRFPLDSLKLFISTLHVCERHGGSAAEPLETVVEAILERQRLERFADAQTASGRMQLRALAVTPVVFFLLMALLLPTGTDILVHEIRGQFIVLAIAGLTIAAVWLGARILDRARTA
jgi:tight adherence protein B